MLIFGLLFGVLSAMFDSLGFVIQKKGHLEAAERKIYFLKHYTWIIGQICTILAVPFLLIALNLSSQTALSFVPGMAIIFITLWSRLILKVALTLYDLLALAFLIPGIMLIVASSTIHKIDLISWKLTSYLFSLQSIIFLSIMATLLVGLGVLVFKVLGNFNELNADTTDVNVTSGDMETQCEEKPKIDILDYKW